MTSSIKTYSTASNARRAAKKAGHTLDQVEILTIKGAYYFEVVQAKESIVITDASYGVETKADGQIVDADNGSEIVPAEEFHSVSEAEHAAHRGEVLNKSTIKRPCKRVWIIADDMLAANPDVKRKDVIAACIAAGVAFYTARTQYQQWLGVRKEMASREATKK